MTKNNGNFVQNTKLELKVILTTKLMFILILFAFLKMSICSNKHYYSGLFLGYEPFFLIVFLDYHYQLPVRGLSALV